MKTIIFTLLLIILLPSINATAQQSNKSLYKQTREMADIMIQYEADKGSVMRFYSVSSRQGERDNGYNTPDRRQRLLSLIDDYQKQMLKLDFASMDIKGGKKQVRSHCKVFTFFRSYI